MSEEIRKGDPELSAIADKLEGTMIGDLTREIAENGDDYSWAADIDKEIESKTSQEIQADIEAYFERQRQEYGDIPSIDAVKRHKALCTSKGRDDVAGKVDNDAL